MTPLLLPLAWIYHGVTALRNTLFDRGVLPSRQFSLPLIGVGNLAVGGTGKTPHTEWIVERLTAHIGKVGILSRGYGRTTRGFRRVMATSTASEVGDEPLQMRLHFDTPQVLCAVSENRCKGVERLLEAAPDLDAIVLDDAFQHRYIRPGMNILLTDYRCLYANDYLLPAGRLRESRRGAQRAQIIIVTKCPSDLSRADRSRVLQALAPLPYQDVYFTTLAYAPLPKVSDALLITGIAHPEPLLEHLSAEGIEVEHLHFADHHRFTDADRRCILERAEAHPLILTTQKDAVRLAELNLPEAIASRLHPIRITPRFLFDEEDAFINTLHNYVSKDSRNSSLD